MQLDKIITAEDRKVRLPWWALLCMFFGAILLMFFFDHFGKLTLARPFFCSIAVIISAVAMRWRLRQQTWFWTTIAAIVALHIPLILFVPWTADWIPVVVILPIAIADLYAILAIVAVVEKFMGRRENPDAPGH